ncbi:MAG TPA: lysine--tRNA ligase [Chloroflexia bacterium]|nr:lysine--tRNA ligase [Chloroflexia bacterium]
MPTTPESYPGLPLGDQEQQRLAKLDQLRAAGLDPYPPRYSRTHTPAAALTAFAAWETAHPPAADGTRATDPLRVRTAGRVMGRRIMGKASFAHIQSAEARLQLFFRADDLVTPPYDYESFKKLVDLGDHLGVEGFLFRTKTGEPSLHVERFQLLSKSLTPLPEKWHGLQDQELRYRQRYLDLIANPEVRRVFQGRSAVVTAMRRYLDSHGFLEVETPVLQPLYGGATARPFVTHHNTLDQDLYLRIADELYLKRLIVGGFEKVYEIGHDFRNEGIDARHNPEFTMMECYEAYGDYNSMMALVEGLVVYIAQDVLGTLQIHHRGHAIDLTPPWRRVTMRDALREASGLDFADYYDDQTGFYERVRALHVEVNPTMTWPQILDAAVGTLVEPTLIQPTFLTDYPAAISPLAKRSLTDPHLVERFEPFCSGFELGNAFSELNDPLDQYRRFAESAANRRAGDEEAHQMDLDFVNALLVGMPPTGGLGLGVDRLAMVLFDQPSIRDVILFPHMRSR